MVLVNADEAERDEHSHAPAEFLVIDFHLFALKRGEPLDLLQFVGGIMDAVFPALPFRHEQGSDAVHLEIVVRSVAWVGNEEFAAAVLPYRTVV